MKRLSTILLTSIVVTGCAGVLEKQGPLCYGNAFIAGKETSVPIYAARKQVKQIQYKAGDQFGWRWVGKSNFTSTNCDK